MTYKLPEGWYRVELSELVESKSTGLDAIRRAPIVSHYTGFKCLRIQDISQKKSYEDWGNTEVREADFKKFQLRKEDILIARTGATVGVNKYIDQDYKAVFNNGIIRIRIDKMLTNSKYVFYNLISYFFKAYIYGISGATVAQPNIKINDLLKFELNCPPLKEQEVIADTLSSLDNKIELNNKINENLEQQAEAIFKHWFIDFEFPDENGNPYKSSGGEMVESELGMIPKEWEVIKLGDEFNFIKGKVPKYIEPTVKGSYPYLTKTVIDGDWSEVKYGLDETGVKCVLLDVLMMMDGSSSSEVFYGHEGLIGSTLALIDAKDDNIREILFMYFNTFYENIKDQNTGSAIPHANKNYINNIKISIPKSNDIFRNLASTFKLFRVKILRNHIQNQTLSQLRDALLPKLMSGEIRIPLD